MNAPHSSQIEQILKEYQASRNGLTETEAAQRLKKYGPNQLPVTKPIKVWNIFLRQFMSPLIYILMIAAALATVLGDFADAFFIALILLINAVIGTIQEYSAEKSAEALRQKTVSKAVVERNDEVFEIETRNLVPGDMVLLEDGKIVPADLRLIDSHNLEIDESLLTGESIAVEKSFDQILSEDVTLGDRKNMAFTGTFVTRGRAKGLVVATGLKTELGKIADVLIEGPITKPPLLIRMGQFTKNIAYLVLIVIGIMAVFLIYKGQAWENVLLYAIALSVAAVPEGLPVALTVALAIASQRMSKRKVIIRKLPAVEALGSCTYIATDKTGTLTVNQLTIQEIYLSDYTKFSVSGTGLDPNGKIEQEVNQTTQTSDSLKTLIVSGILCNNAELIQKEHKWMGTGDAVDLAFLVLGEKAKINPNRIRDEYHLVDEVLFESQNQYAATLHESNNEKIISVKGAFEKLLPMCSQMQASSKFVALEPSQLTKEAEALAEEGFRVLALATKRFSKGDKVILSESLKDLIFLGFVGMIDPLREEAPEAIKKCNKAGIDVAMITGDHPKTSLAIAKKLNLATQISDVVSGIQLKEAKSSEEKMKLIQSAHVFARVEPQQKVEIVQNLMKMGKFVAVTGDGVNDAPALKEAHVGVAMGKSGSDVAKETSDLIITDDRFASIVAGVEEGRVAYANIRKVVYLLIATGVAEIFIFLLAIFFNTPLPLTAVQILWLNLVTNGIQDVGLAFEPGEGDELSNPPRKPKERIFNRRMIEQVILSALVMGGVSFVFFYFTLSFHSNVDLARNLTLLLMVLFENVMVGNCRSETKSIFRLNPLKNPVLLIGTVAAQLIHIIAMYVPGLRDILSISPVSLHDWMQLFVLALSILVVMEFYKLIRRKFA